MDAGPPRLTLSRVLSVLFKDFNMLSHSCKGIGSLPAYRPRGPARLYGRSLARLVHAPVARGESKAAAWRPITFCPMLAVSRQGKQRQHCVLHYRMFAGTQTHCKGFTACMRCILGYPIGGLATQKGIQKPESFQGITTPLSTLSDHPWPVYPTVPRTLPFPYVFIGNPAEGYTRVIPRIPRVGLPMGQKILPDHHGRVLGDLHIYYTIMVFVYTQEEMW